MTSVKAAMETMDELFGAVIATSLVKMAVFLPVLFFPGATGTIYKQFAATILFSIGISTFNALTFSPMLSALLLSKETKELSRQQYATAGVALGFVYGLLRAGNGSAAVIVPTVVWCPDWLHRFQDHRYAVTASLCRRWSSAVGLVITGVHLLQSTSGSSFHLDRPGSRLLHPGDLQPTSTVSTAVSSSVMH